MMQMAVTTKVSSSAKRTDDQIPSIAKKMGRIRTALTWNTRVRKNDIIAEIAPLLSAVNNADAKMFIPVRTNA